MDRLANRLRSALTIDRLGDFRKESQEQQKGCFYFSLLCVWEALNPDSVLPQDIENDLLHNDRNFDDRDLGVSIREIVDRVEDLRDKLGLVVYRVDVTQEQLEHDPPEQFLRQFLWLPESIELRLGSQNLSPEGPSSSGMIAWRRPDGIGHVTALNEGRVLKGKKYAGKRAQSWSRKMGFTPRFIFRIRKG